MYIESIRNQKGTFSVWTNSFDEYEIRVKVRDNKRFPRGKIIKVCQGREEYLKYKEILLRDI